MTAGPPPVPACAQVVFQVPMPVLLVEDPPAFEAYAVELVRRRLPSADHPLVEFGDIELTDLTDWARTRDVALGVDAMPDSMRLYRVWWPTPQPPGVGDG